MTLVADSARDLAFDPSTSSLAVKAITRFSADKLPTSSYSGLWNGTPEISRRHIAFTKKATSRFLESELQHDGRRFPFRTFGQSLHSVSGGGFVEHVLRHDQTALIEALAASPKQWLTNAFASFSGLTRAVANSLASRINRDLLKAAYGTPLQLEVAQIVSAEYQQQVSGALKKGIGTFVTLLSRLPWLFCAAVFCGIILTLAHPWRPFSEHSWILAARNASYAKATLLMLVPVLAYFIAATLPLAIFRKPETEQVLESIVLVQGGARWKTLLSIGAIVALSLALAVTLEVR